MKDFFLMKNDVEFDASLGSTRFFKVAKCKAGSGNVVVKVRYYIVH